MHFSAHEGILGNLYFLCFCLRIKENLVFVHYWLLQCGQWLSWCLTVSELARNPGRINRSVYSESQFIASHYNCVMHQAEDHLITFVLLWGALKILSMNGKLKVLHLPETGKIWSSFHKCSFNDARFCDIIMGCKRSFTI